MVHKLSNKHVHTDGHTDVPFCSRPLEESLREGLDTFEFDTYTHTSIQIDVERVRGERNLSLSCGVFVFSLSRALSIFHSPLSSTHNCSLRKTTFSTHPHTLSLLLSHALSLLTHLMTYMSTRLHGRQTIHPLSLSPHLRNTTVDRHTHSLSLLLLSLRLAHSLSASRSLSLTVSLTLSHLLAHALSPSRSHLSLTPSHLLSLRLALTLSPSHPHGSAPYGRRTLCTDLSHTHTSTIRVTHQRGEEREKITNQSKKEERAERKLEKKTAEKGSRDRQ